VKKGYKQTEVGVIPEDWEVTPLGQISDVIMGQSPLGNTYNKAGEGIALINGPTEFTDIYPVKVQWTTHPTKICKKNDLLICVRGSSTGRMNVSDDEYCIGRGVAAIRAKSLSNTVYLTNQIHLGIERLLSLSAGSTFPNVDGKSIRSILIPLPPAKAEQIAIAAALSDADVMIQSLEKLIAKKRLIKQGAMQELLKPKEGWVVKKLGEVAEIVTGATPPTLVKGYWTGDIPWITPTDISAKKDISNSERKITNLGLTVIRKLPANTLLVTCIASIGKNSILRKEGACNQQINALIPNDDNDVEFLYYLIENNKQYLLSKAGITATNIISKKDFAEITFSIPPLPEQTRIATILADMDAEIFTLETKLSKYKLIKQGMMQELLTGRTRLV
jgi:type I restriction enzyme S subunit